MKILLWVFPIMALICTVSCTEDTFEFPDSEPLIIGSNQINGLAGTTVKINATVSDPAGLEQVSIVYADWNLNEQLSIGSSAVEFNVSYDLNIPETAEDGSTHLIKIVAVNVNGIEKEYSVTVSLKSDSGFPTIENKTNVALAFLQDGVDVVLRIDATDNQSIARFSIIGANISDVIEVNATSYSYSKELNIQSPGIYHFAVSAEDTDGNVTRDTIELGAFEPFGKMYLADVDSDADLVSDLMGVPMLINGFEEEEKVGKVFEAHYYNASAGTAIRFLPNNHSFSPLTIGKSNDDGLLTLGSDVNVNPIVLNETGYHKIVIDLRDLTYNVEKYNPTDTIYSYTLVMGTGVKVNGESTCVNNADGTDGACWWFGSGKTFQKDETNPYLFYGEVELYDYNPDQTGETGFILGANLNGWSDFWRFDKGENPEATVLNGGANYLFGASEFGTYQVEFDTHLNRFKMIPKQ